MLLPDLVNQDALAASVSKLDIDERPRYRGEKKHISEDEDDVVNVVWLVVLDYKDLVVGVRVVGGRHVYHKDHAA